MLPSSKRIRLVSDIQDAKNDNSTNASIQPCDTTLFGWDYYQSKSLIVGYLRRIGNQLQYKHECGKLGI